MRIGLTRRLRRWGAALLVAAYAFGVLGPTVAFAHADAASIVHVLSEAHGGMLTLHVHNENVHDAHVHHDGERHDHSTKGGSNLAHHCCGVIAFPGLQPASDISILRPQLTRTLFALTAPSLSGAGLTRLDRPPRYPLPL
jgi:hypothetical protein